MVIWLLGISGSGKTTLANELKNYLDTKDIKSFVVDGDLVRDFFNRDLGYTKEDRIANIKRVMITAYALELNGIVPIVANISPFEFLRKHARNKFQNYIEIYLKRDMQTIKNKDFVYEDKNVVGVDVEFEYPKNADLVIDTNGCSIDEALKQLIKQVNL
jgi:adenylylsulfate kinase-like enzyme